ncbi:hypothetical protein SAMN02745866_02141 [Alteromonadaceae bacterium Bs31]|nr:hypothetical protein SAMN02745866_02141 [Alteromonadaceae bacterium Bs31]
MHFSGKGAGAGMMLSSSMGPMGIAIGVAIDEGIAKEIGEAAGKAEFDIAQIVKAAFDRSKINQPLNVVVAHYGFVTAPSEEGVDDPVLPKLVLNVIGENLSKAIELDVYAGVAEGLCEKQAVELASVKSDGALVHTAFMVAAECSAVLVLEQAYN